MLTASGLQLIETGLKLFALVSLLLVLVMWLMPLTGDCLLTLTSLGINLLCTVASDNEAATGFIYSDWLNIALFICLSLQETLDVCVLFALSL